MVYGSGLRSPSGKTSSSASVDSTPPVLAELSHVLPDMLLESDSRGSADLD